MIVLDVRRIFTSVSHSPGIRTYNPFKKPNSSIFVLGFHGGVVVVTVVVVVGVAEMVDVDAELECAVGP
jgi:hypothetical protein